MTFPSINYTLISFIDLKSNYQSTYAITYSTFNLLWSFNKLGWSTETTYEWPVGPSRHALYIS
jgi:hypothetical protein